MKIFLSENKPQYQTYTFNYAVYALKESQAELDTIYAKGFLPYSANSSIEPEVFYMARSLRVEIADFQDSSENRRVSRLIEPLGIQLKVLPKSDFDLHSVAFRDLSSKYIAERIGDDNMSEERWDYILSRETGSHFFVFESAERPYGYVLAAITEQSVQYWFALFDTAFMRSHSLGKYMMWAVIDWAKQNQKDYVYLGTAYKPAALYKIRDHKGLSFFDGNSWNKDIKLLKNLCETDLESAEADSFKLMEDPNAYLKQL
jgi:leucyl-tRNA---protein transferase